MRARRRPIIVAGTPYFGARAVALLNAAGLDATQLATDATAPRWRRRMSVARAIAGVVGGAALYQIGGPRISRWLRAAASATHRPIVLHWVGTDVLQLRADVSLQPECNDDSIVHWADAPWLAAELAEYGIPARVVPLAAIRETTPVSFPSGTFTVLTYCPARRFAFYGGPLMMELARRMPDIRFYVLANEGATVWAPPANVRFLGWQHDMDDVYRSCHALVRLTEHDGLSFMVLEAMSHERPVLWNRPLDGATLALDAESAAAHLRALAGAYARGESIRNERGRTYVLRTFEWRETRDRLADEMAAAIGATQRADYAHA